MRKVIYLSLLILVNISCSKDFEQMNTNPDTPTTVPPDFIATGLILNTTNSSSGKLLFSDSWLMKTTSYTELVENLMYNKFTRTGLSFTNLKTSKNMVDLANENSLMPQEEKDAYEGLNYFLRAYSFYNSTMGLGDIPCSEAVLSEEGNLAPKYDAQEDVFVTIINDLDKAAELFNKASHLGGDFIYGGDTKMWEKMVNSFQLRVLNMLSNKSTVGGINVKSKFEEVAKRPLFSAESESYMRTYGANVQNEWYPFYFEKQNYWAYPVMGEQFVNTLKSLKDRRLFYYAEPTPVAVEAGVSPSSYDAYSGVSTVLPFGDIQSEFNNGLHSPINKRYHRKKDGEPRKFISYSEIQFILAEAAVRGWDTPSSAEEHYNNAVTASMKFTADNTPDDFKHEVVIDDAYISEYLAGEAKFDGTVKQIIVQKYISSFVQLPWNSYYDYRRTGFPELPINPETSLNEVPTQLPLRWMYPSSEYSLNKENIEAALNRQFGGVSETPNDVMWLLK